MPDFLCFGAVLLIGAVLLYHYYSRRPGVSHEAKYTFTGAPDFQIPASWHLFSPAERLFLHALDRTIGHQYRIFAKVRLEDVIAALRKNPNTFIQWQSAALMHVDYVICDRRDLSIVACIELDDKSHYWEDVKRRDAIKDRAIATARIPFLRFPAQRAYDLAGIKSKLQAVLPVVVENSLTPPVLCSKCGYHLVLREIVSGPHQGNPLVRCGNIEVCGEVVGLVSEA